MPPVDINVMPARWVLVGDAEKSQAMLTSIPANAAGEAIPLDAIKRIVRHIGQGSDLEYVVLTGTEEDFGPEIYSFLLRLGHPDPAGYKQECVRVIRDCWQRFQETGRCDSNDVKKVLEEMSGMINANAVLGQGTYTASEVGTSAANDKGEPVNLQFIQKERVCNLIHWVNMHLHSRLACQHCGLVSNDYQVRFINGLIYSGCVHCGKVQSIESGDGQYEFKVIDAKSG